MTRLLTTLCCICAISLSHAQVGMWQVEAVTVGDQEMTPVSKWFDIRDDSTVLSGNGNIINVRGTYDYDPATKKGVFTDIGGEVDPYGAFDIVFSDTVMTWRRMEEGMPVVVTLKLIDQIPYAPWDMCAGVWNSQGEEDAKRLIMSWDRSYRLISDNKAQRGIWHIPGHNEYRLTTYREDGQTEQWNLSFPDDTTMVWTSDFGEERTFVKAGN